ncbi:MAG: ribosome silencing factor [Chloroflexota bacterium]|nr:ribosome silencing factor [Chloroflexota bacterium]
MDGLELARLAVSAAEDKKAEDIVLLDLRNISGVADYFVICSGNVSRQIDAIADNIQEMLKAEDKTIKRRVEGPGDSGWVLLDYSDLVVHIFTPARRAFYNLEGLWKAAPVLLRVQ